MGGAQIHDQRNDGQPGDERPFLGDDDRLKAILRTEDAVGGEIGAVFGKGELKERQQMRPRLALKIFREIWKDHILSRILGSATRCGEQQPACACRDARIRGESAA